MRLDDFSVSNIKTMNVKKNVKTMMKPTSTSLLLAISDYLTVALTLKYVFI